MAGNEPTLEASAVFRRAFVHSVPRGLSQRLRRRPLSGELCAFRAAGNEPTLEASAVFGRALVHSVPREMSQRLRRRPLLGLDLCVAMLFSLSKKKKEAGATPSFLETEQKKSVLRFEAFPG